MNDETRARLLELAQRNFVGVSPEMRSELLTFFSAVHGDYAAKRNRKRWRNLQQDLQQLKASAGWEPVISAALP